MDEVSNPFRPGVNCPPVAAARSEAIAAFDARLARDESQLPNIRLVGIRGMGKTCQMNQFKDRASRAGWTCLHWELDERENSEAGLARLVGSLISDATPRKSRLRRAAAKLPTIAAWVLRSLKADVNDAVSIRFDPSLTKTERDLTTALLGISRDAARRRSKGVVLLLDEAHVLIDDDTRDGDYPLSTLVAACTQVQRDPKVRFFVVLAGLPRLDSQLQGTKTNSLRMFDLVRLGLLSRDASETVLRKPLETRFKLDAAAFGDVYDETAGHPYFLQLWGAELWRFAAERGEPVITTDSVDAVRPQVTDRIYRSYMDATVDNLAEPAFTVMREAAGCRYPPLERSRLLAREALTAAEIDEAVRGLIDEGVLQQAGAQVYEFSVPQMYEYLRDRFL